MMEVVVTTGALRRVNFSQFITTNKLTPGFLQATLPVTRPTVSEH